jgi:hypothetical protein
MEINQKNKNHYQQGIYASALIINLRWSDDFSIVISAIASY